MIELFYSSSPNVLKVMVALEEMKLDYEIRFVDLSKGEQFDADKIAGSPTAKVPVLRDHAPDDGGAPITVFESGAIMTYVAEKTGRFLPTAPRERLEVLQWLTWQMANLGPIGGQFWHFERFAERLEPGTDFTYPRRRYRRMLDAIWDVMEARLRKSDHLAGRHGLLSVGALSRPRRRPPTGPGALARRASGPPGGSGRLSPECGVQDRVWPQRAPGRGLPLRGAGPQHARILRGAYSAASAMVVGPSLTRARRARARSFSFRSSLVRRVTTQPFSRRWSSQREAMRRMTGNSPSICL
jgi:GSH-dependent disulfide-bond oxidoreductase